MGDGLVAHHLPCLDVSIKIIVRKDEIAQLIKTYCCVGGHRTAIHTHLDLFRNRLRFEEISLIPQHIVALGNDKPGYKKKTKQKKRKNLVFHIIKSVLLPFKHFSWRELDIFTIHIAHYAMIVNLFPFTFRAQQGGTIRTIL